MLPIEKTKQNLDLGQQTTLIYGRAKIGKSTLCSQFEAPLFLATEAGLNHLEVHRVIVNSWPKFLESCKELAAGNHSFKTVVIDTIDNLVVLCSEYVCKENGISHESELPHGKGWHMITSELRRVLVKLQSLPYGLVMVSHSKLIEVETKTRKYNRYTISIGGANRNLFLNMADLILFVDSAASKDGEERRVIRTKPSMNWEAGDRTGRLPEVMPLDYESLAKNFK